MTAVLIPCYNEAKTIEKVVTDFKKVLPDAQIYVYDNNSTDGTAEIAEKAGAIVRHEYRQGKGNVIRSMFRDIEADCYIMTDGDDTYPAQYAKEMEEMVLKKNADMVVGDRLTATYFTENKRAFHNTGNKLVRKLVNMIFKGNVTDIMTGYRAFSPLFVKSFPIQSKGFEIETEMTIHALDKNFHIVSLPVDYRDRPEGSVSKLNTVSDGIKVLKKIVRLFKDYKPLAFFGLAALLFALVGIILFIPILIEFLKTGLVPKMPTLLGAGVLLIISMLSLVCGLVLDTVAKKQRDQFEIELNIIKMLLKK